MSTPLEEKAREWLYPKNIYPHDYANWMKERADSLVALLTQVQAEAREAALAEVEAQFLIQRQKASLEFESAVSEGYDVRSRYFEARTNTFEDAIGICRALAQAAAPAKVSGATSAARDGDAT